MVFVWSLLVRGDPAYTLVQVAVNDLIMLIAFAPIVVFLLGVSDISVPWDTVLLSVTLYIVIPWRSATAPGSGCCDARVRSGSTRCS
jgi:arsenite transporter